MSEEGCLAKYEEAGTERVYTQKAQEQAVWNAVIKKGFKEGRL